MHAGDLSVQPLAPASDSVRLPAQPPTRAWAVLTILCFVYVLNFLDRQLLSILAKPIQDELGITDGAHRDGRVQTPRERPHPLELERRPCLAAIASRGSAVPVIDGVIQKKGSET